MTLPLTGKCQCGIVKYEITETPKRMGLCHCRSCQRATGSAYYPFVATTADALIIKGKVAWYETIGETGYKVNRGFCSNCGSRLFSKPDALPNLRTVAAGTLDDPSIFKPEVAVWMEDAVSWNDITSTLIHFDKNSPAFQKIPEIV